MEALAGIARARQRGACWSAAPGCTCAPWPAACRSTIPATMPAIRARLEERLAAEGLPALAGGAVEPRARTGRRHRSWPTPAAWCGPWSGPPCWATCRHRHRSATRRRCSGWASSLAPDAQLAVIEQRVRAQFRDGLLDEASSCATATARSLRAVQRDGLSRSLRRAGRTQRARGGHPADAIRTRQYARRQRTWFRAEDDIRWLPAGDGTRSGAGEGTLAAAWPLVERSAPRRPPPRHGSATAAASGHVS